MTTSDGVGVNGEPEWPEWFPDACPPDSAVPAVGEFFRLIGGDVVVEEDFTSHLELHLAGRQRRFWTDDVQAASCSLFGDRADADKTRGAIGSLRHKRVAKGHVTGSGVMEHTPGKRTGSHHSWWRPNEDHAWESFEVTP